MPYRRITHRHRASRPTPPGWVFPIGKKPPGKNDRPGQETGGCDQERSVAGSVDQRARTFLPAELVIAETLADRGAAVVALVEDSSVSRRQSDALVDGKVAQPAYNVGGECLQRRLRVLDDDGGQRCGSGAQYGHCARFAGLAGVVVPVNVLACEGDEEAARLGLPAVEDGWCGHRHCAVALDRSFDSRGDLTDAERDHVRVARGSAVCSDMLGDATAGAISPAYRKPHTCWQHHAVLTWVHDLQRAGAASVSLR